MSESRLRLLGSPRAEARGETVAFGAERRFQLLAYLARRRDWISRDELAHLFWPDQDNASARRNLRFVLHSVRELPFTASLESDRERVRWSAGTDVAAFEHALAENRWSDAVELYRGIFLDGLETNASEPFREWLVSTRSLLAESFRDAASRLAREAAERGQAEVAVGIAKRLLEADPFDEPALQILMRALAVSGRQVHAQRAYQTFVERLMDELGLEPSAETRAIARGLDISHAPLPLTAGAATPAGAATTFIGRREELAQIDTLLEQPECRLLTIIGPGGIGKSRIAMEWAAARGAVPVVALEHQTVPSQIASQVARVLGLDVRGGTEAETRVAEHVRANPGAMILDNFEHLIDGGELLARWLAACPQLKLIVTSRERLDIDGEWILRLEGLGVPHPGAAGEARQEADAVRLFVARARRLDPSFDVASEIDGICEIVMLTDGMPLAIELAAPWIAMLPCTEIAKDLRASLDVLATEGRTRRDEHQSLRASFEHSWALLLPRERHLLSRLAVFEGGFALEALRSIAQTALPAIASLVDKSLVRSGRNGRFSLHPLLRQFARDKLRNDSKSEREINERHARFFLGLIEACDEARCRDPSSAFANIDADFENCLAAWQLAVREGLFEPLGAAIVPWAAYLERRGRMREARELFREAADAPALQSAPSRIRAHLTRANAFFLLRVGALSEAQEHAHEALAMFRQIRDNRGILLCVNLLGMTWWQRGEYERAKPYFREGLKRSRMEQDLRGEWRFGMNLALAEQTVGNLAEATGLFEMAAANARQRGDRADLAITLNNLGNLCVAAGDDAHARVHLAESLALAEQTGDRLAPPFILINLAILDIAAGELERAREYVGRALESVRRGSDRQVEPMCLYTLARIEGGSGNFGEARKLLGQAARIAVETRNVPNMIEIAIWWADVDARQDIPERAVETLALVLDHPRAGMSERKTAQQQFRELASRLPAAACDQARRKASALTLESVMARVATGDHAASA